MDHATIEFAEVRSLLTLASNCVSAEALSWAKRTKVGDATRKAILFVLADYADDNASCFPGQATIAGQAETSERTVRRVLGEFEETGLLRREHRHKGRLGRTSDRIFLDLAWTPGQMTLDPQWTTDQPDTVAGGQPDRRSETTDLPDTHDRPTGHSLAGELLEEPPVRKSAPSPDLIFETLAEVCAIDWRNPTATERAILNRTARELREVRATPMQIRERAAAYVVKYERQRLTPNALVKHWSSLRAEGHAERPTAPVLPDCDECGNSRVVMVNENGRDVASRCACVTAVPV